MIAIRRIFGAKKYFHPMIQPKSIHAKCSHDIQESEPRDWRSLRFFYGKQSGLLAYKSAGRIVMYRMLFILREY